MIVTKYSREKVNIYFSDSEESEYTGRRVHVVDYWDVNSVNQSVFVFTSNKCEPLYCAKSILIEQTTFSSVALIFGVVLVASRHRSHNLLKTNLISDGNAADLQSVYFVAKHDKRTGHGRGRLQPLGGFIKDLKNLCSHIHTSRRRYFTTF